MDLQLSGKRVVVTGGTSGIGAAIAREFASEGARVAITGLKADAAVNRQVETLGEGAFALTADVAKADEVARMFAEIDQRWGGLDVLVNNAGIDGDRALAWEADLAAWRRVIEVNLMGAFLCAREALKRMVAAR